MLEVKEITKIYNPGTVSESRLFDKFSLSVPDGQFVSIVGSNGSGKTSLLNLICGSIPLDGGDICVGGESLHKLSEHQRYARIGRVYQNPSLGTAPNLTMLENLSLADNKGKAFGLSFGVNRKRTDFYREQLAALGLGLEDKLGVKMGALSGGQRQAVALVMATLTPLEFLILDEHTAALDPKTADVIMDLTHRMVREKHLTAMMVTHNLRYAVTYGDRLLMFDGGQVVLDRAGAEKAATTAQELMSRFNPDRPAEGNA
ncbi:MAG: ATP-binding cassette domain-containing protein [Oscillospiraceae bacterium]